MMSFIARLIPKPQAPTAPILIARIRSTAPELYRWGKDRSPGDPEVKRWSNILRHLSFREGFPVIGQKKENGKDLVIIDITAFGMKEEGILVDYVTLERELVDIRQVN
jgi:hypothetical protein